MTTHKKLNEQLLEAAGKGEAEKVKALLAAGAEIEARDSHGRTALRIAAFHCHAGIVEYLIAKGADLNAKDFEIGATPLMVVAQSERTGIVKALIKAGAEVEEKSGDGRTALACAAYNGKRLPHPLVVETMQALLEKKANAENAVNALRNMEDAAEGLATLFAAGAFAPDAAAIADCCRDALEGIADPGQDNAAALKAALNKLWP